MTCPCLYPLVIEVNGVIVYLSYPLDVLEETGGVAPVPEFIDETHEEGEKGYMKLRYLPKNPRLKRYEITEGHIVFAGCEEENLQCEHKSIFEVWHPKKDWESYHNLKLTYENNQMKFVGKK
jgi:hypothetical protein